MRSYTLYLTDIADAMAKIEEFVAGMTYEEFRLDDKTQSAVIRKFEVIGEAAKKIPCGSGAPPFPGARWQGCGIDWSTHISASIRCLSGKRS